MTTYWHPSFEKWPGPGNRPYDVIAVQREAATHEVLQRIRVNSIRDLTKGRTMFEAFMAKRAA